MECRTKSGDDKFWEGGGAESWVPAFAGMTFNFVIPACIAGIHWADTP